MSISRRIFSIGSSAVLANFALGGKSKANPNVDWPQKVSNRLYQFLPQRLHTVGTLSTMPQGWEHGFKIDEYRNRAQFPACKIIIQNAFFDQAEDWLTLPFDRGYLSFAVNKELGIKNLNRDFVQDILYGNVTKWPSDVGIKRDIQLARVRPPSHKESFDRRVGLFLENGGIDSSRVFSRTRTVHSYTELKELIRSNSNVIGIGLREVELGGVTILSIDNKQIGPGFSSKGYPFTLDSNISLRTNLHQGPNIDYAISVLSARYQADLKYWSAVNYS